MEIFSFARRFQTPLVMRDHWLHRHTVGKRSLFNPFNLIVKERILLVDGLVKLSPIRLF